MLSSWTPAYIGVAEMAERYAGYVSATSGGALNIDLTGPEAVPPFEQLQPVAVGLFDLLFTHGAYHFGTTGVGMAMDAVRGNPAKRRESGIWNLVDAHYRTFGFKLLALPTSNAGYHFLLREAVGPRCNLSGRKLRGTPVYHGLLDALDASAVVLPPGEVYSALEKNVIDGAGWPATGGLDFKWYEVSSHFLRPTFGTVTHLLLMNIDAWNQLPKAAQTLLLEQGQRLEEESLERFDLLAQKEEAALSKFGLAKTELCGDALNKLAQHWADGVWRLTTKKSGAAVRSLHEAAIGAGLTP